MPVQIRTATFVRFLTSATTLGDDVVLEDDATRELLDAIEEAMAALGDQLTVYEDGDIEYGGRLITGRPEALDVIRTLHAHGPLTRKDLARNLTGDADANPMMSISRARDALKATPMQIVFRRDDGRYHLVDPKKI